MLALDIGSKRKSETDNAPKSKRKATLEKFESNFTGSPRKKTTRSQSFYTPPLPSATFVTARSQLAGLTSQQPLPSLPSTEPTPSPFKRIELQTPPTPPTTLPFHVDLTKEAITNKQTIEKTYVAKETPQQTYVAKETPQQTQPRTKKIRNIRDLGNKRREFYFKKDQNDSLPLSPQQQFIYDTVLKDSKSIFFTGSAGTGKSFLLRRLVKALRQKYPEEDAVQVTATTGIAALHINGRTIHSFAGIELGDAPYPILQRKALSRKKYWKAVKVLVIDEISMLSGRLFRDLENIARSIRGDNRPFGGIQLVLSGDFFQLPPIRMEEKFCFEVDEWSVIQHTVELVQVFRQSDQSFVRCLNELRHGLCTRETEAFLRQAARPLPIEDGVLPTRLYCTNRDVDAENSRELDQIKAVPLVYQSFDNSGALLDPSIPKTERAAIQRLMKVSCSNCIANEFLRLKVGAQVMLVRNLDVNVCLVNGSRGVVTGFKAVVLENTEEVFDYLEDKAVTERFCKFQDKHFAQNNQDNLPQFLQQQQEQIKKDLDGKSSAASVYFFPIVRFANGMEITVPPVSFCVHFGSKEYWYRTQIPLKLAWAITAHKSQGLTLDRVQINVSNSFAAGQAYVALSRVSCVSGLQLLNFSPRTIFTSKTVLQYYATNCNDPIAAQLLPVAGVGARCQFSSLPAPKRVLQPGSQRSQSDISSPDSNFTGSTANSVPVQQRHGAIAVYQRSSSAPVFQRPIATQPSQPPIETIIIRDSPPSRPNIQLLKEPSAFIPIDVLFSASSVSPIDKLTSKASPEKNTTKPRFIIDDDLFD